MRKTGKMSVYCCKFLKIVERAVSCFCTEVSNSLYDEQNLIQNKQTNKQNKMVLLRNYDNKN